MAPRASSCSTTTTTIPKMRCSRPRTFRISREPIAAPVTPRAHTRSVGFGPMNMTQATHAVLVHNLRYLPRYRHGEFLHGCREPRAAAAPRRSHLRLDGCAGDCSDCHTTANWNSTTLPAGHMPNPANQACTVCHTTAPTDYTTDDAGGQRGPAYRHRRQLRTVPWRHTPLWSGTTISRPRTRYSRPRTFRICREPIAAPAIPRHLCSRHLRADDYDAGQTCLRAR